MPRRHRHTHAEPSTHRHAGNKCFWVFLVNCSIETVLSADNVYYCTSIQGRAHVVQFNLLLSRSIRFHAIVVVFYGTFSLVPFTLPSLSLSLTLVSPTPMMYRKVLWMRGYDVLESIELKTMKCHIQAITLAFSFHFLSYQHSSSARTQMLRLPGADVKHLRRIK